MRRVSLAALSLIVSATTALAADPRYPDWPCNQIKVPELSAAAVWAGPPIDDVGDAWQNDPTIRDLVARVAARRTSQDDAEKAIADYFASATGDKQTQAKLLFAGIFTTLNRERTVVMDGIERFARLQRQSAERIRDEVSEMRALQDAPNRDDAKVEDLGNKINWETQVFQDKRKTIGYVCEVPTIIEQRLGALARAIQQAVE
jgi:hypothetical protein